MYYVEAAKRTNMFANIENTKYACANARECPWTKSDQPKMFVNNGTLYDVWITTIIPNIKNVREQWDVVWRMNNDNNP